MPSERQKRKHRKRTREERAAPPAPPEEEEEFVERYRARAQARNEAARDKLEPLEEGDRPRAVTIGALLSVALAVGNPVAFAVGVEVQGRKPSLFSVLLLSVLLLAMGIGMWRMRYWAVLGLQALLGVSLVFSGLSVMLAAPIVPAILITVLVLIPLGTLFWFLVKAMARIQMPDRPR